MKRIVDVHHPDLDAELLEQALIKFYWLREQNELRKKPSTTELVDWIAMLQTRRHRAPWSSRSTLPFLGTLLKKEQDMQAFVNQVSGRRRF